MRFRVFLPLLPLLLAAVAAGCEPFDYVDFGPFYEYTYDDTLVVDVPAGPVHLALVQPADHVWRQAPTPSPIFSSFVPDTALQGRLRLRLRVEAESYSKTPHPSRLTWWQQDTLYVWYATRPHVEHPEHSGTSGKTSGAAGVNTSPRQTIYRVALVVIDAPPGQAVTFERQVWRE